MNLSKLALALVYRSEVRPISSLPSSLCWGLNLTNVGYGKRKGSTLTSGLEVVDMKIESFKGRRWLATISVATALAVTGFYGLRAATLAAFENPAPTIKMAQRSEAASGRGYSAVA